MLIGACNPMLRPIPLFQDLHSFERLFKKPMSPQDASKLSKQKQEYAGESVCVVDDGV